MLSHLNQFLKKRGQANKFANDGASGVHLKFLCFVLRITLDKRTSSWGGCKLHYLEIEIESVKRELFEIRIANNKMG